MVWENLNLSPMMKYHNSEIYLTFSHYLPKSISDNFPSIVGVSNLAPFSREAWEAENFFIKNTSFSFKKDDSILLQKGNKSLSSFNDMQKFTGGAWY